MCLSESHKEMPTMEISLTSCLELPDLLRHHETVSLGEAGPSGLVTCTGGSLKGEVGRERDIGAFCR